MDKPLKHIQPDSLTVQKRRQEILERATRIKDMCEAAGCFDRATSRFYSRFPQYCVDGDGNMNNLPLPFLENEIEAFEYHASSTMGDQWQPVCECFQFVEKVWNSDSFLKSV